MLTAMGRVFSTTENLSEDAFSGYEDQWPDALESELRSLERMLSRFQEDESEREVIDLLVAGRPQLGRWQTMPKQR